MAFEPTFHDPVHDRFRNAVPEDGAYGEIDGAIRQLAWRTKRLQTLTGSGCGPGCTDCAPCRKARDEWGCKLLLNDIRHGNISRWQAKKDLAIAVKTVEAKTREFARASAGPFDQHDFHNGGCAGCLGEAQPTGQD